MKTFHVALLLGLGLFGVRSEAASLLGSAQPGVFRQTDLDAGGWLTGFASHAGGRLYARTDVGGVYRSDDRGDSWRFLSGDLTTGASHSVQGLAVGETSADLVFQAVGRNYPTDSGIGVWRSMDGGASWAQVLASINFSGNDDLRWQGECLAFTPGSLDQEIWAISRQGGLWRSTTGGGSGAWSKQNGSAFDGMTGHVVHMDAAFPNDVFIGGEKGTAASALFKGTRGAGTTVTWTAVTVNAATTSVTRLARLPSGVMFAAVQDGGANRFYKSNAAGTTWTDITSTVLGGLTSNGPVGMCHVLRDGSTIVLGWIGGPTRKSINGGTTWSTVPLAITGTRPVAMLTSETSPSWSRGALHQDPLDANRWYLPNGFGPFRSTDAGATVQYMTRGIGEVVTWKPAFHPNDPLRIYLPVADLIGFVVTDGGATGGAQRNPRRSLPVSFGNVGMTYATKALVGPVVGNAAPKVYFTGGSSFGPNDGRASILATADDGQTWSLVHVAGVTGSGLPTGSEIVSGSIAPDNANEILVAVHDTAAANSGIYRSTNGGVAFTKATGVPAGGDWGSQFSRFVFLESDPATATRRFGWLNGVGFLLSNDRGVTWASAGHSASGPGAGKLYDWNTWGFFSRDAVSGRLWFGGLAGHLGLAYSTNNGTNWTYLDTPFSNTGFSEIQALDARDGQVLVCGRRFGDSFAKIYYSSDNGVAWHDCSKAGFRLPTTSEVALDPHHRGSFWVATNGRSYARFTPGAFGAWQQQNFTALELNDPAISAPLADPEPDGFNNVAEYALALDPRAPSPGTAVAPRLIAGSGSIPDFRFRRNAAASDVTYLIRNSPDLLTWTTQHSITGATALPSAFGPGISLIADPATQDITFRSSGASPKEFFRVEIQLAP
ncbi:MAG: hypothetical protein K8R23_04345 [Chthoniobacter sp.]|nr:hypothetical protein [Chthoniobacter sp.]